MLVLLSAIVIVGIVGMRHMQNTGEHILPDRIQKIRLVQSMGVAARERTVLLQRMLLVEDPFERDLLSVDFNIQGARFAQARIALLEKELSEPEKALLERQSRSSGASARTQNDVVDLIAVDDIKNAKALLTQKAMPAQDEVLAVLSELMKYQTTAANDTVNKARTEFKVGLSITVVMLGSAAVIAILLGWLVSKAARQRRVYFDQMQAANLAKSSFLAKMSHEMRTPLTAIIGFAEASLDSQQSMDERISALWIIRQSGNHLLKIINDLLDLAKIEAEKLDVDLCECSLFPILNDVQALVQMQAQSKQLKFGINYTYPLPAHIYTDPLRLKQIVINLCGNALKFTQTGFVYINVGFDRTSGRLTIAVQDSGIGLAPQEQSRLFQDFHQADTGVQRKYGGTGLGLSLSQKLAAMLGGKISLNSEKGVGSTFTLELAQSSAVRELVFADGAAQVPVAMAPHEARHFSGRVLCAEDTPELSQLMSLLLRRMGLMPVMVENGALAVERAAQERFDLILLDIQMPVLDGVSAMIKLKESRCDIPVIAVTANAMKEDQAHYRAVGFADVLVKPIDRSQLQRVLETYLPAAEPADPPDSGPIYAKFASADDAADAEMHRIMNAFADKLPGYCEQLKQAIAACQWAQAREVAHQLRGLGGGMGYPIITEIASTLQFQLKTKNYADVENIYKRLVSVAARIQMGKAGLSAA